jgi:hypothetical protein
MGERTYLDGLRAAMGACHKHRERCLEDRRESIADGDTAAQGYATAEALATRKPIPARGAQGFWKWTPP